MMKNTSFQSKSMYPVTQNRSNSFSTWYRHQFWV